MTNTAKSETPRTDAVCDELPVQCYGTCDAAVNFARQLERELASALAAVTSLAKERNEARADVETAKAERQAALNVVQDLKQNCVNMESEVERLTRELKITDASRAVCLRDCVLAQQEAQRNKTLWQQEYQRCNQLSAQLAASRPTAEMVEACAREISNAPLGPSSMFRSEEQRADTWRKTVSVIITNHFCK